MYLTEWKNKPKNDELILLEIQDLSSYIGDRAWHDKSIPKQEKMACIYNCKTDLVSDVSIYLDSINNREYIKNKNKKYYIDDFKSN